MTNEATETPVAECKDQQLVTWAVAHGWKYHYGTDQLADPRGFMTTTGNWSAIGSAVRERIIAQMNLAGVYSLPSEG